MMITQEQIFEKKKQLQEEIEQFEAKLTELVAKQATIKKIEDLAQSILEYNDLERQISDRTQLFALLSEPPESLRRPMVKSALFDYFEAAETVSIEMVDFIVSDFLTQIREDVQAGEDTDLDSVEAEYKEYVLPGKIIAERFDEIDPLMDEMVRFCRLVDAGYDEKRANEVLEYAFGKSVLADTKMDPTIKALRELQFTFLTPEARARLLDQVEEHLAVLRYEEVKNQNIAMDKAVAMMEKKEGEGK
ncbi:MAG: hypothetical protein ABIG66_01890 [Candidatus Kerfeldbacteria bacterium]